MKILKRWVQYCVEDKHHQNMDMVPLIMTWVLDEEPFIFCMDCRSGLCRYRVEPAPNHPRHLEPGIGHSEWPPVVEWHDYRWGLVATFERDPLAFIMEQLL